jgi:hypothetical protein
MVKASAVLDACLAAAPVFLSRPSRSFIVAAESSTIRAERLLFSVGIFPLAILEGVFRLAYNRRHFFDASLIYIGES